ncbi:mitochondrial import inner membrane translocase subunit tim54 [Acarospora aff. strigata]|nr:mitochondrial import inner membrane translocase subunit tim54 [Acarospora aff. strigata]
MADKSASPAGVPLKAVTEAPPKAPEPPPKRNPAFRMMGLPNFRFKLPSRNWLIFLSITGSFTSALLYDRHQRKLAQRKWCTLVSHLALEPLPVNTLQRKLTIYLSAPPGDSLRSAREYFQEYVKPVLVAAALDWEVVEGRREGDVRVGLAEKVRRLRRKRGEAGQAELEEDAEALVDQTRQRSGTQDYDGLKGDIVIGRHTWKEYIRGLHEGWLGPLDLPQTPEPSTTLPEMPLLDPTSTANSSPPLDDPQPAQDDSPRTSPPATTATDTNPEKEPEKESPKPKPTTPTPPYLPTISYPTSSLAPTIPPTFEPSAPLPFPHILGFLNTPIRIYRFLTRRHLTDSIGRQTAAVILASHRPYAQTSSFASSIDPDSQPSPSSSSTSSAAAAHVDAGAVVESGTAYEQAHVLTHEEREWHKSARKRVDGEGERVWLDEVVLDPRVAERMRRFELSAADEERAERIAEGKEGVLGRPVGEGQEESLLSLSGVLGMVGLGSKESGGQKPGWVQGEEGDEEA